MIVLCILVGVIILQTFYLMFLNKRNNKRRTAAGKTGRNVDYSLEDSKDWAKIRATEDARNLADGNIAEEYNTMAFADMTDLDNDEFVYSL